MKRTAIERALRPFWLRVTCIFGLGLTLSLWVWSVIAQRYPGTGGGDGPFFFRLIEAGKVSLSRWGELPLWNPYECGGVPLWDNPQSIVAAPLILALQPFNTAVTMGIWVVLHVATGFLGMWLLCREELGSSRIAASCAACLFAFSASHSNHAGGGHTAFLAFQFTPLALLLWRRAEKDARCAIGLGLLAALMFYEGGVYAPAYIGLMLAIETLTRCSDAARLVTIVRASALVLLTTASVAAARLLPVLDQLAHHRRGLGPESDFIDWQLLKDMYLDRSHALRFGHEYVWGEYVSYVGPVILVLAAIGLVVSGAAESWLLVVGLALFVLMLGHFRPWAPWSILKTYVPPFSSMRVPARFRLLLVMCIAAWVALAIDRFPKFLERLAGRSSVVRAVRVAVTVAALIGAGDVAGHSIDIIGPQWNGPAPGRVVASPRLYLGGPNLAQFIDQPRQNRGRLECWEEWVPHSAEALWVGDLPQARVLTGNASLAEVTRTQNSFVVEVDASGPTTLLFNTSYARGWRTNVGATREMGHQLAVDVPVGHHRVRVWYWPVGLTLGFGITAVGLVMAIAFLYRLRGRISAA